MKDYKMTEEKFMATNHCLKDFPENKTVCFKIRSFIYDKLNIWDIWDVFPYKWSMWYYEVIKPIFRPSNSRIRKSVPRQYRDVTSLIVDINFEFIKAFYEDEYVDGVVDWTATEHHQEFAHWLELSYKWITQRRPELEEEKDDAYPKRSGDFWDSFVEITDENGKKLYQFKDDGILYEEKYGEVNRLEKVIEEKDTEILTQLIKRREYFWT
jgi:hypothetical protein